MKLFLRKPAPCFFITLLVIASRLPQLLSDNLLLDGDECIIGLMAKHLSEGEKISYFFWGQRYGFSFLETSIIAIAYKLFGTSVYAIKLSMLLLWLAAIILFYKTANHIFQHKQTPALLLTVFFILLPAWGVWAMKARGGYLTAFLLSNFVLYMLFKKQGNLRAIEWMLCGIFSVFIFYSQPFFLIGILPFVAWVILKKPLPTAFFSLTFGTAIALTSIFFMQLDTINYWKPQVLQIPFKHYGITDFLENIFQHATGYYFLNKPYTPPPITVVTVIFFFLLLITSLFFALIQLFKKKQVAHIMLLPALIAVIAILSYAFVINMSHLRYFLPLTGFALLLTACAFHRVKLSTLMITAAVLVLVCSSFSMYFFKRYQFDNHTQKEILELIASLERKNITHVFSTDSQLQWKLMFYSKEGLIARYKYASDRQPAYIQEVNKTFRRTPQHTALITQSPDTVLQTNLDIQIGDKFFVYTKLTESQLKDYGFQFYE